MPIMMTATKSLKYNTRRLLPGDDFEVKSEREARVLRAIRKATRKSDAESSAPSPFETAENVGGGAPSGDVGSGTVESTSTPPAPARNPLDHDGGEHKGGSTVPSQTDDLAALRAEYEVALSKRPFNGWSADELRQRIAAHKAGAQS